GWLYEAGGVTLPFLAVAGAAVAAAGGFAWLPMDPALSARAPASTLRVLRAPAVSACACAVVVLGGTLAMVEPVYSLFLSTNLHLGPFRIGLVFGGAALVNTAAHPVFGRLADRLGSRRLTLSGLLFMALALPGLGLPESFVTAMIASILFTL